MKLKLFLSNYCSLLESEVLDTELTKFLQQAFYIVNPYFSVLVGKWILIDLPFPYKLHKLSEYNKILSRFPIPGWEIELFPYELPKNPKYVKDEDYSLLILNKYIMNNLKDIQKVNNSEYLLGLESDIDGYMTAVGYKIVTTDLERFKESDDSTT